MNSFEIRYCEQNLLNVLFFEKRNGFKNLMKINSKDFEKVGSIKMIRLISQNNIVVKEVFSKGNIYISESSKWYNLTKVKKYWNILKVWENEDDLDSSYHFCACALIDKIYIIDS